MKKIEMIIRPENLEDLVDELDKCGVNGMTVYNVLGCGKQKGAKEMYRGTEISIKLLHKVKVEVIVLDDMVEKVILVTKRILQTGKVGDGKIFVCDVLEGVRIRTGERGAEVV